MDSRMEAVMEHLSRYQISNFFSNSAPTTQQQCDQEAARILGGSVRPAPVQGGSSYTVLSNANNGAFVVQFRLGRSILDLGLLGYVEQIYEDFVPRHTSTGTLGELHIYTMNNVGGVSMYLARERLKLHNFSPLRQIVQDFARFFALAWHNTPDSMPCPSRDSLLNECLPQLSKLARGLPMRFRPTLDYLIGRLPKLFANDWPLVPNHNDLLENNIHVDPETGHIMGICDWRDTTIGPFGVSLGALEAMLGIRTLDCWQYHPNHQQLRDLFWETFYNATGQVSLEQRKLIDDARLVGIFLANGFEADDDRNIIPAREGAETLGYLESVTLGLWAETEQ